MSFWADPFVENLSCEGKLLYIYLFTSPHTNNLGILEISKRKISNETGLSVKQVESVLDQLIHERKIVMDGYKILLLKFVKNQTSFSANLIRGLRSLFAKEESELLKQHLQASYPNIFRQTETPLKGIEPLQTVENPSEPLGLYEVEYEVEKEVEKEVENEVEKEGEYEVELEGEGEYELEEKAEVKTDKHYARSTISCPHQKIIDLYHRVLPELPAVVEWTEARKKMLAQRWREKKERQNLEWWERYFYRVKASDFLTGKVENRKGSSPFLADLEWLIRPSNLPKVIEGRYDNRKGKDIYQQASEMGLDECIKEFYSGFEIPVQKPQAVMKHD